MNDFQTLSMCCFEVISKFKKTHTLLYVHFISNLNQCAGLFKTQTKRTNDLNRTSFYIVSLIFYY